MSHKLCDEAQRLLYRHTANKIDDVWIVAMADLLHGIDLVQKIVSLTTSR